MFGRIGAGELRGEEGVEGGKEFDEDVMVK